MSMMKPVLMSNGGRLTIPAEARKQLGVSGETQFQVDVVQGSIRLRPAVTVPRDDAWAYTPEYRSLVNRSRKEAAAGLTTTLSPADLDKLAE
jgi:bifunctional DNA-binding transcriptional regulator/antitoxin component of YhaV-PrlF toxin-antitoxin module